MLRIKTHWGLAIQEACKYSSVPPEFLATLIANESGGRPEVRRFEPAIFQKLQAVRNGTQRAWGSLDARYLIKLSDNDLRELATSWGLTQILGWHALFWGRAPADLLEPQFNLNLAVRLLARFAQAFQLDLRTEFESLLRCWNTGQPADNPKTPRIEGRTSDPKYVENGLARMEIYRGLGTRDMGLGKEAAG